MQSRSLSRLDPHERHSSILVASWISSLLYMLVIREAIRYFSSFKGDSLQVKLFVLAATLIDGVSMIAIYADVYMVSSYETRALPGHILIDALQYTITHWGQ